MSSSKFSTKKYLLALVITSVVFALVFYSNQKLNERRYADIRSVQDEVALDILSSETQFNLLRESSCKNVSDSVLSQEISEIARKLEYMAENSSAKNSDEFNRLRKYYALLQIKDYLLMQNIAEKCNVKVVSLLYFYGQKEDCPECDRMGLTLTHLREAYPEVRIYSFDTNLDLSAVKTLTAVNHISDEKLPAVVYGDKVLVGARSVDEMKEEIPFFVKLDKAHADAQKKAAEDAKKEDAKK